MVYLLVADNNFGDALRVISLGVPSRFPCWPVRVDSAGWVGDVLGGPVVGVFFWRLDVFG